jgi:hypothetical protein
MESCSFYDVGCWLLWLLEAMGNGALYLLEALLNGLAFVYESIPVPSFLESLPSLSLPPSVLWTAEPFQIPSGVGIIVTAYTARFILRRIPFIG